VQPAPASRHASFGQLFDALMGNVELVIQGKRDAIRLALVCLFAGGHLLIEDVPGVGKTLLAKSIARTIGCTWRRIQFTPDLLPTDITGSHILQERDGRKEFVFHPGPVFTNLLLADEINRASPKTQSALLEAMEERQVTVDAHTYRLERPFMVIATQNPIELEGTYPLPEAQLDRFLMRIEMGYPNRESEVTILETHGRHTHLEDLAPVASAGEIVAGVDLAASVHVAANIKGYIVDLVEASRRHRELALGVSPRGALALQRSARALAASLAREYVVPDDVKRLAPSVLEHRLLVAPDAQLRGVTPDTVMRSLLTSVPVPGATG
jgi:MoxR-like ATPase